MKRPVRWSRQALDDFKEQIDYIQARNPAAARRVADKILAATRSLGEFAVGRPGRMIGTYEKPVIGLPYIVAYEIFSGAEVETIFVLRVIHTARDWHAGRWPQ